MANASMFEDFYQVPDLKFDIQKLRGLKDILEKKFNTLGRPHFGAIMMNQIPGDKSSTTGHMLEGFIGLSQTIPVKKSKEIKKLMRKNIVN